MTLLFLSYWGIDEGLAQSTVVPHVRVLTSFPEIDAVILCTIERQEKYSIFSAAKVKHIPLRSRNFGNVFLNKIADFVLFSKHLKNIVIENSIDFMICRSSLAGAIGYLVHRLTRLPYVVESYEPHALYMLESGVWKKWDPRFLLERFFQRQQNKTAAFLIPVSNHYAKLLQSRGVSPDKVCVVPCVVDRKIFARSERSKRRTELKIAHETTVGIYVGKFGGIYYDAEAFMVFSKAKQFFQDFKLIILTPQPVPEIESKLISAGFTRDQFVVRNVPYTEVPEYLSAADFGFATYKASPSKRFLSPIKVGEYWACGLPVLLTRNTGDDADIIAESGCGALFLPNPADLEQAFIQIATQLQDALVVEKNTMLADKYRSFSILEQAYQRIVKSFCK